MPRRARLTLPNVPLHLIQRGNNRQACFFADQDYRFYLTWLGEHAGKCGCRIHAYVLMTNHVHLLLSADDAEAPGALMKAGELTHQSHLPAQRHAVGRALPVVPDAGRDLFADVQRYIELNPVRAAMVAHPGEYRWSSYAANAQGEVDAMVQPHHLYQALGTTPADRQAAYRELFRHHLDRGLVDEIRRATSGDFALGNEGFAQQVAEVLGRRVTSGKAGRPRKLLEVQTEALPG